MSQAGRIQETTEYPIEKRTRDQFQCGEEASERLGRTAVLLEVA